MAYCAVLDNDFLKVTTTPIEECSGFVILDNIEYLNYQTYNLLFQMPSVDEAMNIFNIGFNTVVIVFLAGYSIKKINQILKG